MAPGRSAGLLGGARELDKETWLTCLAEPFTVPIIDWRDDRVWGGTVDGGAIESRFVLAVAVGLRDIAAGVISRVMLADELVESNCLVGDLLGD